MQKTAARSAEAILLSEYLKIEATVELGYIRDTARRMQNVDFEFELPRMDSERLSRNTRRGSD